MHFAYSPEPADCGVAKGPSISAPRQARRVVEKIDALTYRISYAGKASPSP